MRISILKSDNAVEDQLKPVKEKLLREIRKTIHLFDCDYTSFLKNIIREYKRFITCDKPSS
jgi:hypothetical protein